MPLMISDAAISFHYYAFAIFISFSFRHFRHYCWYFLRYATMLLSLLIFIFAIEYWEMIFLRLRHFQLSE
jgi:hypothetical protein